MILRAAFAARRIFSSAIIGAVFFDLSTSIEKSLYVYTMSKKVDAIRFCHI